jgi:hypothetical protein
MMTKEELQKEIEYILIKNEHWKSCQDGSYEMALNEDGYHRLKALLDEIEETEQ